ncbi:MAG TPA: ROK family protein [Bryobacteraceae bacterium]|nr:ROK family protein [Bryobacteraceae bacterium]
MATYSIGVDLGGTNLRVAAVSEQGKVLDKLSIPAVFTAGPEHVVNDIVTTITAIRSHIGVSGLRGVGIGVPGFIDMDRGVVVGSANLPGFEDFPVRDSIQRVLGTTIVMENDANAAALGEMWVGGGRDVKDLMLLTLGTGIGGGIVIDGRVLHGHMGMAGEIGHMTVYPDGNPCGCGNCGCLEKHASATAIAAMGRMMHFGEHVTAEGVYDLARQGNQRAILIFKSVGRALGIALGNMINVFNFPLYLLTGGPLPAWDMFAPAMFEEIKSRSLTFARTNTRVEKAVLGSDAGLYGAAYLPLQSSSVLEVAAVGR